MIAVNRKSLNHSTAKAAQVPRAIHGTVILSLKVFVLHQTCDTSHSRHNVSTGSGWNMFRAAIRWSAVIGSCTSHVLAGVSAAELDST
jgi:hypothetical protein